MTELKPIEIITVVTRRPTRWYYLDVRKDFMTSRKTEEKLKSCWYKESDVLRAGLNYILSLDKEEFEKVLKQYK